MVAAGRGDDTRGRHRAREQVREGAAGLERSGPLQQLQLHDHARLRETEVGACHLDDRRPANVGLNKRVDALDIGSVDRLAHGSAEQPLELLEVAGAGERLFPVDQVALHQLGQRLFERE